MAMTVEFSMGTRRVVLPEPKPGAVIHWVREQASGVSAGGQRYVYDKGIDRTVLRMTFEALTDAQRAALEEFFEDAAMGMMNLFTFTDSAGVRWTARFAARELAFHRVRHDEWRVEVALEAERAG